MSTELTRELDLLSSPPASPVERPETPENCPICLENYKDKACANACVHAFCFVCLKTWAEKKPKCPVCLTPFDAIYHNIRKDDDYDVYSLSSSTGAQTVRQTTGRSSPQSASGMATSNQPLATTSAGGRTVRNVKREEVYRYMLGNESSRYEDVFGGSSSDYFSRSRARINRVEPFIRRELTAIKTFVPSLNVEQTLKEVLRLLPRYNLQSNEFFVALVRHTNVYTGKFICELQHFTRSPYNVPADFDRATSYRVLRDVVVECASDGDSTNRPTWRTGGDNDVQVIGPPHVPRRNRGSRNRTWNTNLVPICTAGTTFASTNTGANVSHSHNTRSGSGSVDTTHGMNFTPTYAFDEVRRSTNTRDNDGQRSRPTYAFEPVRRGYTHSAHGSLTYGFGNNFNFTNGPTHYTPGVPPHNIGGPFGSSNRYTHAMNLTPTYGFHNNFGSGNTHYTHSTNLSTIYIGGSASGGQSAGQTNQNSVGGRDAAVMSDTKARAGTNALVPTAHGEVQNSVKRKDAGCDGSRKKVRPRDDSSIDNSIESSDNSGGGSDSNEDQGDDTGMHE